MLHGWKVCMLLAASAVTAEPSRALSLVYNKPFKNVMFVPKRYLARQSRVLFLDENENHQQYGRGEIDLTLDKNSKVKFDDATDYEFTSPDDEGTTKSTDEFPSGNERFYEPLPRFRPFQSYPSYYNGRFGRPYAPNFGFDFQPSFAPAVRTGLYQGYNGWKARSPRVVFPYASDNVNSVNALHTNSHAGPSFDNVVFREQPFANEVGEDQGLQDINAAGNDAFAERDANDLHRARRKSKSKNALIKPMFIQTEPKYPLKRSDLFPNATAAVLPEFKPISDEQMERITKILKDMPRKNRKGRLINSSETKQNLLLNEKQKTDLPLKEDRQDEKKCPQGGTCEFFFYCWMVGGLLEGSCGGLLKGCCHRVAKAGILGVQDSNSIDYISSEQFSFGPVINDESKSIELWIGIRKRNNETLTLLDPTKSDLNTDISFCPLKLKNDTNDKPCYLNI